MVAPDRRIAGVRSRAEGGTMAAEIETLLSLAYALRNPDVDGCVTLGPTDCAAAADALIFKAMALAVKNADAEPLPPEK